MDRYDELVENTTRTSWWAEEPLRIQALGLATFGVVAAIASTILAMSGGEWRPIFAMVALIPAAVASGALVLLVSSLRILTRSVQLLPSVVGLVLFGLMNTAGLIVALRPGDADFAARLLWAVLPTLSCAVLLSSTVRLPSLARLELRDRLRDLLPRPARGHSGAEA